MLSKCANPACVNRFLYLHDGTLFKVEVERAPLDGSEQGMRVRKLEHYWLCSTCARSMTVVYENGSVVTRLARPALSPVPPDKKPAQAA